MTPVNGNHGNHGDDGLDAFLRGEDELARALQALPQPAPSAELTQKILADAQRALSQPVAANDERLPGVNHRPPPGIFRRLRIPLAVAASATLVVLIGLQWQQTPTESPQIVAQATPPVVKPAVDPTVEPASPHSAPDASVPPQPTPPTQAKPATPPPAMIAQTNPMPFGQGSVIMRGLPPLYPQPPEDATAEAQQAEAWLAKIEQLIAQEKPAEALSEWKQFRAAHPQFPIPEKTAQQIETLPH